MQLRAELVNRPISDLTREVLTWYDALYKASSGIDSYKIPRAPILTTDSAKKSYIWQLLLTMSINNADTILKDLTSDNKKRKK